MLKKTLPISLVLILSACNSTSPPEPLGTDPVPMQIASQINVVTASQGTNLAAQTTDYFLRSINDAGTDYSNDVPEFYVRLEALEPLETANMVLCYMNQLGISDPSTLNQGDYLALVDPSLCEKGKASGNSQAGEQASTMYRFVVNNSRADGESPQIVKIWLDLPQDHGGQVRGEMTITAGAAEAPPFGLFTFNWVQSVEDPQNPRMRGSLVVFNRDPETNGPLENGNVGLTLYTQELPFFGSQKMNNIDLADVFGEYGHFVRAASAVMMTDENRSVVSGRALTQVKVIDSRTNEAIDIGQVLEDLNINPDDFDIEMFSRTFAMSYNEDNLLIQSAHLYEQLPYVVDAENDNQGLCLSRHNFDEAVWCYNLYDAQTGSRVELNSGFPFTIQKEACGERRMFGHVGYFGLWFEGDRLGNSNCQIEDGDVVLKNNRNDQQSEEFEIKKTTGRLVKNTILQLELSRLKDLQLQMHQLPNDSKLFQNPESHDPNPYEALVALKESQNFQVDSWIVNYLTTNAGVSEDGFYITAFLSRPQTGGEIITLLSNVEGVDGLLERYDVTPRDFDGQQIWMYSQQLGGSVRYTKGHNAVIFTKHENVDFNDTLFNQSDAPQNLICLWDCLKSNITNEDQITYQGVRLGDEGYTTGDNGVRYVPYHISRTDMGLKNLDNEDITLADGAQSGGAYSWGIHMGPLVSQETLQNLTNWWDLWNTVGLVFYNWETGSNSWNTGVKVTRVGTGEVIQFEKPIQFTYTHTTANDRSGSDAHDDETFLLSYQGTCQLHGIPHREVKRGRDSRYYPEFAIADGTVMGAEDEYVVKAIFGEQNPLPADGQCSLLSISDPAIGIPSQVSGIPENITVQMPDITVVTVYNGVVIK